MTETGFFLVTKLNFIPGAPGKMPKYPLFGVLSEVLSFFDPAPLGVGVPSFSIPSEPG